MIKMKNFPGSIHPNPFMPVLCYGPGNTGNQEGTGYHPLFSEDAFAQDVMQVNDPFVCVFLNNEQLGDVVLPHDAQCVDQ